MDRNTFGELFNRTMEDMEKLASEMPTPSKGQRHIANAIRELAAMAEWMGFKFIPFEEYEAKRKARKPSLRSVK